MREIKFRVWDTVDKKMILPEEEENRVKSDWPILLAIGFHGLPICIDKDSFKDNEIIGWNRDHNLIPMQYTGLKDKNGKEIYEGDIVMIRTEFYDGHNEDSAHDRTYKGQIVFTATKGFVLKNPSWYCHLSGANGMDNFYKSISLTRCEVIGNIHENPELLK